MLALECVVSSTRRCQIVLQKIFWKLHSPPVLSRCSHFSTPSPLFRNLTLLLGGKGMVPLDFSNKTPLCFRICQGLGNGLHIVFTELLDLSSSPNSQKLKHLSPAEMKWIITHKSHATWENDWKCYLERAGLVRLRGEMRLTGRSKMNLRVGSGACWHLE